MTAVDVSAAYAVIEAANKHFMSVFAQADAERIASLYTESAQLLPPGGPVAYGWEAIRAFWRAAMENGITAVALEIAEVEDHGDTIIEVSRYTLLGAADQVFDQGKYIVIWKLERGQWYLHRDIFNSNGQLNVE